jgi:hypothetical protein
MNALKAHLSSQLPTRIVTRSMQDFAERGDAALKQGVITIVHQGMQDLENIPGELANSGLRRVAIIAQLFVSGVDACDVEDAESDFADELLRALDKDCLPRELGPVAISELRQSSQLEFPYGWVAIQLTLPNL